jgi:hypothetical protein
MIIEKLINVEPRRSNINIIGVPQIEVGNSGPTKLVLIKDVIEEIFLISLSQKDPSNIDRIANSNAYSDYLHSKTKEKSSYKQKKQT